MRNSMKVAKWEVKKNLKNKSFLIGLFLTPLIIIGFGLISGWVGSDSDEEAATESINVFVNDQLDIFDTLQDIADQSGFSWEMQLTDINETEAAVEAADTEQTAFLFIDERALEEGIVPVYTSDEISPFFINEVTTLQTPILAVHMEQLGITAEEAAVLTRGIQFEEITPEKLAESGEKTGMAQGEDFLEQMVPAAFAAVIMFSIVLTGMAIFQSASQEKKDKISEIILSSLKPEELMQGKIIGYFILGLIQVLVLFVFLIPFVLWKTDIPLFEYLFVPELILLVAIALLSYLMFAAIFVGIGATMEDMSTAGNFQGLVMMLPFLPFVFIGPVFGDPSGLWAQIGTYIPFTAPGVLLMRLSMLEQWPWVEIIISLAIIIVSAWIFMKLAGKIFKTGILMYGKNATPAEIWKWIRS